MRDFFIHQNGANSATVGGVRALTDFSTESVTLRVHGGEVTITGEKLQIERFDENEIEIRGRITSTATEVSRRKRSLM